MFQLRKGLKLHVRRVKDFCTNLKASYPIMDESTGPPTLYTYKNCLAMETLAMKLPAPSFCTDVKARQVFGTLQLLG